jgi:hypothetical protein
MIAIQTPKASQESQNKVDENLIQVLESLLSIDRGAILAHIARGFPRNLNKPDRNHMVCYLVLAGNKYQWSQAANW